MTEEEAAESPTADKSAVSRLLRTLGTLRGDRVVAVDRELETKIQPFHWEVRVLLKNRKSMSLFFGQLEKPESEDPAVGAGTPGPGAARRGFHRAMGLPASGPRRCPAAGHRVGKSLGGPAVGALGCPQWRASEDCRR